MTEPLATEKQSQNSYLDLGKSGKSAWWRYVLGFLIIIISYVVLGTIVLVGILIIANGGKLPHIEPSGDVKGIDPLVNYVALNLGFWVIVLFNYLVVRFLHARSFLSLITPAAKFNWKRVGFGFFFWFSTNAIVSLVLASAFPQDYKYSLQSPDFFLFAPLVLFLTPIQCFAEELFFRGYLLQFLGKLTYSKWWLSGISGLLFMLPHFMNPEVSVEPVPIMLSYFTIGFFLTLATLRSNSLEVAIGMHIGNNLFSGLVVNYSVSALETRSIFLCTKMHPWFELLTTIAVAAFLYVFLRRQFPSLMKEPQN